MNEISEKLGHFMTRKNNDCYFKLDSDPKQFICKIDYDTFKLAIIVLKDSEKEYEESCKEIQDVIASIFKELEWSLVKDMDEFKVKLIDMRDRLFKELVNKFPYDVKSVTLVNLNECGSIIKE